MTGTSKAKRYWRFGLLAVASLVVGCLMAQALWWASRNRYDEPDSGYYYRSVHGSFSGPDTNAYLFHFKGHSETRWHWLNRHRNTGTRSRCFTDAPPETIHAVLPLGIASDSEKPPTETGNRQQSHTR